MLDCWWGIAAAKGPKEYDFSPYLAIANMSKEVGLKLQYVLSFHQCGGNHGDACDIPLPYWVLSVGQDNPDIFYTDAQGNRDQEYLSLGVDNQTLWDGMTAVDLYTHFMSAFADAFSDYLGETLVEVQVSLGPAGEMRYPSYQLDKWSFPGIGEFQCYDKYMLAMLSAHAQAVGQPDWGHGGPSDAGTYNSQPSNAPFFEDNSSDNYASDYGHFFLSWYSDVLIEHGRVILTAAQSIFSQHNTKIAAKVSGIHWWYLTDSHAAELTAGYYNTATNDGYAPIAQMFHAVGAAFDFTCLEMKDSEQQNCQCGPQELVKQTKAAASGSQVPYQGENALQRYDQDAYSEIEYMAGFGYDIAAFTYLRLTPDLLQSNNWQTFESFVSDMHSL